MNLIITSGNGKNFHQLKNFVASLRSSGEYAGIIAICDNAIGGTWDAPESWSPTGSFNSQQLEFFSDNDVKISSLQELIGENDLDEAVIRNIKSPTQRYPYKFIYNVLISKRFLHKAENILYFDSDVYFQAPVKPIFQQIEKDKILIVREWLKMKEGDFLKKWLRYSDFSRVSSQASYEDDVLNAANFCSGFYGGTATTFHRFNLLALLLTSNQFVNFYSDQPLINILKTFFGFPFKEINWNYCLHLGELSEQRYAIEHGKIIYENRIPISIHFNCGKYAILENILAGRPVMKSEEKSFLKKIGYKIVSMRARLIKKFHL